MKEQELCDELTRISKKLKKMNNYELIVSCDIDRLLGHFNNLKKIGVKIEQV